MSNLQGNIEVHDVYNSKLLHFLVENQYREWDSVLNNVYSHQIPETQTGNKDKTTKPFLTFSSLDNDDTESLDEFMNTKDQNVFHCELCNITCTGRIPAISHVGGKSHLRRRCLAKTGSLAGSENFSVFQEEAGIFFCTICRIIVSGEVNAQQHLDGRKHANMFKNAAHDLGRIQDDLCLSFSKLTVSAPMSSGLPSSTPGLSTQRQGATSQVDMTSLVSNTNQNDSLLTCDVQRQGATTRADMKSLISNINLNNSSLTPSLQRKEATSKVSLTSSLRNTNQRDTLLTCDLQRQGKTYQVDTNSLFTCNPLFISDSQTHEAKPHMNVTSPIRNINQSNSSVTDDLQIRGSSYPLILTSRDSYNKPRNTSSIVKSAAKTRSLQDEERITDDDTNEAGPCGIQNNFHQDLEIDESTDQWRCKVCHVPLNSEKVIRQHFNGRAHHKKKKLVVAVGPCYAEYGVMKQKFVQEEPVAKALVYDHAGFQALSQFATPKQTLNTLLQSSNLPNSNKLVRYETRRIKEVYQTVLRLNWPQEFAITGLGRKKVDSERAAAALACVQLQKLGVLQNDGSPSNGNSTKNPSAIKQHLQKNSLPEFVQLPKDLKQRILTLHTSQEEFLEEGHNGMRFMDEFDPRLEEERIRTTDIITGRERQEISKESLDQRSEFLYNRWQQTRWNQNEAALSATDLPILSERERILSLLENNRVVVLCGETGCGKTTQVPQFILDSYLEKREGAKCNIVVTQPRRISAISVAERVTVERGERMGDTVGYQVRLKSHLPHPNGCILYCTTGILLKKLQSNPTLEGISHIVVDEVHERDINIDFLLVLLKSALRSNPNLSLLLMSASINAEMFSRYFDGCPLISVPGRMYQVQEYFLPEVMDRLQEAGIRHHRKSVNLGDEAEKPETDHDLVVDVVKYLDQVKPPGAILVFLPGWQDIKTVNDRLRNTLRKDGEARYIFPVHSSIPLSEQQQIFQRPPDGRRKIVLATNIAETSITIDDVVYVVNTGSHKEQRYKMNLGVSCLDLFWVSKANIIQRKGRAGRCQPGECYHLFKHETFNMLESYEMPEILRVPLEQIVIMSKVHGPHLPAVEFLSQALQPPAQRSVEKAVSELQELDILDKQENLTLLGQRISHIGTEPRLAKALVMSTIFRCVSPVLTIASRLSSREPFRDSMENRPAVMKVKKSFSDKSYSDHLTAVNLFNQWLGATRDGRETAGNFEDVHLIHRPTMYFIKGLRQQFAENLEEAGLLVSAKDCLMECDSSSDFDDEELTKGVLLRSFFSNVVKATLGKFEQRKLHLRKISFRDHNSPRLLLSRKSVNAAEKSFPSRWFTYFSKMQSGEIFIHDTSMVHPLALVCFSNQVVYCKVPSAQEIERVINTNENSSAEDWSEMMRIVVADGGSKTIGSFYATKDTARVLMKLRKDIKGMVDDSLGLDYRADMTPAMYSRHTALLNILCDVLSTKQDLFMSPTGRKQDSHITGRLPAT